MVNPTNKHTEKTLFFQSLVNHKAVNGLQFDNFELTETRKGKRNQFRKRLFDNKVQTQKKNNGRVSLLSAR